MKIIFIVRQSLDLFWIVEYNFNGNQDKKSHRYSEGQAFILKSIDPKFILAKHHSILNNSLWTIHYS